MEDNDHTVRFILEQQASFAAAIQTLEERQQKLLETQKALQQQQEALLSHHQEFVNNIGRLTDTLGRLATLQEGSNDLVQKLAERLIEMDDRMNTLITSLERHLSDHQIPGSGYIS